MRCKYLTIMSALSMGMAIAVLPMGGNPAHAGPEELNQSSSPNTSGKLRATTNAQRKAAAERAKARRAAAAAAVQKAQGGAK